ncbi:MAG: DUF4853 domain-containing protein [Actinomyces sp.]|nr:DUF4853 domain-containing protein [Actinomyces sp.]
MSGTHRWVRNGTTTLMLALVATAGAVGCTGGDDMDQTFWDGQLPLAQRQTIEDYEEREEPLNDTLRQALSQAGAGPLTALGESTMSACGGGSGSGDEGVAGFEIEGSAVRGAALDVDTVRSIGDRVLGGSGLTASTEHGDDGSTSLKWFDEDNGGYIAVTVVPRSHTGTYYMSGCRPSDGSTSGPGREPPAWEARTQDAQS